MSSINRRRLGRTGLEIAELGLGAMDTPYSKEGPATVTAALDAGIDFIDTAHGYAGSEALLGEVIRARGADGVHFASKTFSHSVNGSQWDIDKSLRTLGVERISLYQLHDISTPAAWEEVMQPDGALAGLRAAQERGLVDFVGVSCHSLEVAELAVRSGEFDTVMVEYSAFAPESSDLIHLASDLDVGVIVMRPVGGSGRTSVMRGHLADGYGGILTPANLLRYVFTHPGVSVAIPGARFPSRIEENVATALDYEPMTASEMRAIEAEAAKLY